MTAQERSMVMSNSTDNPAPVEGAVEMVDRVAAAIFGRNLADCHHVEQFRRFARNAIQAMREPTEAMMRGAAPAMQNVDACLSVARVHGCGLTWVNEEPPLKQAWRAMIDAALNGGPPKPEDQSGESSTTQILPSPYNPLIQIQNDQA